MTNKFYLLLVVLAAIVLSGGISLWYYSQPQQTAPDTPPPDKDQGREQKDQQPNNKEIPIQAQYETKIVYTTDQDVNIANLKQDCQKRDGKFKSCGSICGPGASECASVCAYTCELGPDKDRTEKFGEWETYTNQEVGFSMDYPSDLRISQTSAEVAKFTLLGPTQTEGTEIFDGISVIITTDTNSQKNLKSYIDSQVRETGQVGKITKDPERVVLNGNNGYLYQKETLGTSTVLTFPLKANRIIKISYSAPDPENRGHQQVVQEMIKSFKLLKKDRGTISVNLYYVNGRSPASTCGDIDVSPVLRTIERTKTPIRDTIKLLLQGELEAAEKKQNFSTEFSKDHRINLKAFDLEEGVLTLEFSDPENFSSGGSCRVGLLKSQLQETARQFFEVKEVRIRPRDLFQP